MEFKRLDKRKGSGAASIRSRYAYLIHLPDIDYFPPTNDKGVRLEGDIVLQEGRTMIPVYLTNPSQEYSYETQGADDEKTFLVKFIGTHPGTELEALEFSKNLLEEPFLILIPGCEKNAPGKLLGQPNNPLIFTSTHKAAKEGDKFTFNFEQRIGSEFIYFSYGGVINLPPIPDGPSSEPGTNPGFDPTIWAKRNASNIDGANVLLWHDALNLYSKSEVDALVNALKEDRVLTLGSITATTSSIHLALHSSGINSVEMNGNTRSKNTADHWTFPEVTAEKVFQIYAEDTPAIFGLAEDGEEIPAGALIVATITLSEAGINIEEATAGFKLKANDGWANIYFNASATPYFVSVHHAGLRFNVMSPASGIKIGGINFNQIQYLYDGVTIYVRNETAGDLEFLNVAVSGNQKTFDSGELPLVIKQKETATFAYHAASGVLKAVKMGSTPDLSGYATTAQLTTEKNRNDTQDGQIAGKLDKPTTDGNWVITKSGSTFSFTNASTFGQNISNTNLSNTSARIFTQGNTFVWDANGFKYSLKNIASSVSFTTVLVRNSAQEVESATAQDLYAVWTSATPPTVIELNTNYINYLFVYCPNLTPKRRYERAGSQWVYNTLTDA